LRGIAEDSPNFYFAVSKISMAYESRKFAFPNFYLAESGNIKGLRPKKFGIMKFSPNRRPARRQSLSSGLPRPPRFSSRSKFNRPTGCAGKSGMSRKCFYKIESTAA
jgi:hypothetical protein